MHPRFLASMAWPEGLLVPFSVRLFFLALLFGQQQKPKALLQQFKLMRVGFVSDS